VTKQVEMFPEEVASSKFFVAKGHVLGEGDVTRYYVAKDEAEVTIHINNKPTDDGGFSSYAIEEKEALPEDAYIKCPSCACDFQDKYRVTDLTTDDQ